MASDRQETAAVVLAAFFVRFAGFTGGAVAERSRCERDVENVRGPWSSKSIDV